MYKVLVAFTDLQDNDHKYLPGTTYPRKGLTPSPERIKELSTTANRRGIRLIEGDGSEAKLPIVQAQSLEKEAESLVDNEEPGEGEKPVDEPKKEPVEDFMNPPVESSEPIETDDKPKKRGRKKNAD